ncbi:MAG: 30S ribosomal protein S2 [Patescibacteria group bacterium]
MSTETNIKAGKPIIESMFKAGAHFAFSRSRRHPTVAPYIFGVKNKVEIFDLEKTENLLDQAKNFIASLAKEGKPILFVGGKSEARAAVKAGAQSINMPYVDGRWIGGTLTNAGQIRKRVEMFEKLTTERERGELAKYTKKERLLIDREIANLDRFFSGIVSMKELPKALFVIDPRKEKNAVKEAQDMKIPVIALLGSDCNLKEVDYPIVGNDASVASIKFFVNEITKAYGDAKKA